MSDRETKERLIESAAREFSEKGYNKASLRTICANAGVTTGALYFFFEDKEDLFAAIVEKPIADMTMILQTHFAEHESFFDISFSAEEKYDLSGSHDEFTEQLIHQLYENYDAFILLLTKSQGTRFENTVDRIIDLTELNFIAMAEKMAKHYPGQTVNKYMTHWLTHVTIDAFIHLLTHENNEKKAVAQMSRILDFIVNGSMNLVLMPDNEI